VRPARRQCLHVVFDLDWTIISDLRGIESQGRKIASGHVLEVQGTRYRVTDGTEAIVAELLRDPRVRVSFFSGGHAPRNLEVLEKIRLPGGRSFRDAANRILSRDELTDLAPGRAVAPDFKFWEKYRKDLTKVCADLERVVLVDDIEGFALAGQRRNLLWLGPTYHPYESYEEALTASASEYVPPDAGEWLRDQHRLRGAYEIVAEALRETAAEPNLSFVDRVSARARLLIPRQNTQRNELNKPVDPAETIA
jgi:hypothetical protein